MDAFRILVYHDWDGFHTVELRAPEPGTSPISYTRIVRRFTDEPADWGALLNEMIGEARKLIEEVTHG